MNQKILALIATSCPEIDSKCLMDCQSNGKNSYHRQLFSYAVRDLFPYIRLHEIGSFLNIPLASKIWKYQKTYGDIITVDKREHAKYTVIRHRLVMALAEKGIIPQIKLTS